MKQLTFVDLFAGLGGFHVALARLGHRCVFACEREPELRELYRQNFGILPAGDIRDVSIESIPDHDILCAGFPCQPFSKAGEQEGLDCPKDGDLFGYIRLVLRRHSPRYFILENVPNLLRHEKGTTYTRMKRSLVRLGYKVEERILSPHQFGVPQIRERVCIVGRRGAPSEFNWPRPNGKQTSVHSVLDKYPAEAKAITERTLDCLKVWQRFIRAFPGDEELPSFPIWTMEFGATYPFVDGTPHGVGSRRLAKFRGAHGARLNRVVATERLRALPTYAQTKKRRFPKWKQDFIRQNRDFYNRHKGWLRSWLPEIRQFPPSWQKLEWNCKGEPRNIWDYVLQFRASGVRVKRRTTAPSLVASTTTQVPIVAWERRYMTPRECARLQSLYELKYLPRTEQGSFRALGNAVNADVIELIARALVPSRLRLVKGTAKVRTELSKVYGKVAA